MGAETQRWCTQITDHVCHLGVIIRDALGIAKTRREVVRILSQGKVKVDGRTRYDENYAVGLMDVIELADANVAYRILPIESKGLIDH